jgi:glucokinase-like ROK family protein
MRQNHQPYSTEILGQLNTIVILETIQANGSITRPEIIRKTGLSFSTVLRSTEKLIQSGLIVESGLEASTGGRRSTLLKLNDDDKVVIGIDMGGTKILGGLISLSGNILTKIKVKVDVTSSQTSLDQLFEIIQQLIEESKQRNLRPIGIGVGVPGITDSEGGEIVYSPSLGWEKICLKEMLDERFHSPVVVENDVNLMALGEYGYGVGRGIQNLVLLAFGTGIGSGIIINGRLYRGSTFSAGEVGHMVPGQKFLSGKYEHTHGALEFMCSGTGIASQANAYLHEYDKAGDSPVTAKDVFEAARKGEEWAVKIVSDVVDYITISVANTIVTIDPEEIIFSGGVFESADLLLEPIKKRLDGLIPMHPSIVLSDLGPQAAIMGAAHQVLIEVAKKP